MHVRHFRYLGVLLLLVPVGYVAALGPESLLHVSTGLWVGCTALGGLGFVLASLQRGPFGPRKTLAGSYLIVALATVANAASSLAAESGEFSEPFALFHGLMALCFGYFAYAIGTDNGAFEFDVDG